ncbi:MAG: phosphoribosylanthranilate isomerase [Alphaproteobacteria bacterium]|jgi:phosphoribosylanthranilate isomerase|nr:phosphoribosylanthranilate isomerase [Alphaproteobacteria bacterium]MBO6861448.1 phosphoribosylanthranilate isomerase [Alphaproteobacteria bacterium]MEC9268725.1 phosphoribosylanthranilate isomerase [Pseudomonadota bacterium]
MAVDAKICGITDPQAMEAAVRHGAALIGLVFFPPSPRAVSVDEAAMLAGRVPERVLRVGLFVDPDDELIDQVLARVPLDAIQLHGEEPADRCAGLKARTGREVHKAIKVRDAEDLAAADRYAKVCDRLLFDAKPPADATRPGGNAETFDWTVLEGRSWPVPWLLAGGLTPDNVKSAIRMTGCPGVDASSGLESAPGKKDPAKIAAFLNAVKSA